MIKIDAFEALDPLFPGELSHCQVGLSQSLWSHYKMRFEYGQSG